MASYFRFGFGLGVLLLAALALFAPPDGQQRGEAARLFGNLHPLAVHLPIALLLLVPILEIAGRDLRRRALREAAGFVLGLALLSAIAAACLGWLHARSGGYEGTFVTQHMWGGVAVSAIALWCFVLRGRGAAWAAPSRSYACMLVIAVFAVGWTGYRGGQLAHGEHHLTEHLPASLKELLGLQAGASHDPATFYGARVAPIFERHCVVCHSASKRQGGLRLDSYQALMAGGQSGVAITPHDAQASELFRRVTLNPHDEDFMPAEGKPPLSEDARSILRLWIDAGASPVAGLESIAGAPSLDRESRALTPDYTAERATIERLQGELGILLVARSREPTDGLILRTASAPKRCNDHTLAALAPLAPYIVDAELARTDVTDRGLESLAAFSNLRSLDLTQTSVTSAGMSALARLPNLQQLNLTETAVDEAGVATLRAKETIQQLYVFETPASASGR